MKIFACLRLFSSKLNYFSSLPFCSSLALAADVGSLAALSAEASAELSAAELATALLSWGTSLVGASAHLITRAISTISKVR